MVTAAVLDLFEPEIAPLDAPSPENPALEQNMNWIGSPLASRGKNPKSITRPKFFA